MTATLRVVTPAAVEDPNAAVLVAFKRHMLTRKLSPVTIEDRLAVLGRVARVLAPTALLEASAAQLSAWQETLAHLSRGSIDVYSRHVVAFYRWAVDAELIAVSPTRQMVKVKPRQGVPHPISEPDLRVVLACATGPLRLAYVLAAFAGLRCGEICRLRAEDITIDVAQPVALIHGKGDRERKVPLLPPVVAELQPILDKQRRGSIIQRRDGSPWRPEDLSIASNRFMKEVGVKSTLHSLRHFFASEIARITRDVLLVRDLLGHESLATTQIYMRSTLDGVHDRLAGFTDSAAAFVNNQ